MARTKQLLSLIGLSLFIGHASLAAEQDYAAGGSQQCLGCHDYSDQSPVHPLLETPHGRGEQTGTPMSERGCESCHGPSAAHTMAPTQQSPAVSFGPRWNSGITTQDTQCLNCHQDSVGNNWHKGVHSAENLSCVTCHDAHSDQDKVLGTHSQTEVCAICHKPQKSGIHALASALPDNPPCADCHQAHGNPSPKLQMLQNRSSGCNQCHDLVAMSTDTAVSAKATSYHKTMTQRGRSCIDCHQGIAHAPAGSVAPIIHQAVSTKTITLFAPGQADSDWLLTEHPGSQSLRQGRDCEQCHRGEEAAMGARLVSAGSEPTRKLDVSFTRQRDQLLIKLSWRGAAQDQQIAIMWGDDGNEAFQRGGCWGACHSDMPGMSRDRGRDLEKYLGASRSQQQSIGKPPQTQPTAELDRLLAAGNFVELWRMKLQSNGKAVTTSAAILESIRWHTDSELSGGASYSEGRWHVTLRRSLSGKGDEKSFVAGKQYTFGIALQGAGQSAQAHWVSLPMTFSLDDADSDFISAQQ